MFEKSLSSQGGLEKGRRKQEADKQVKEKIIADIEQHTKLKMCLTADNEKENTCLKQ